MHGKPAVAVRIIGVAVAVAGACLPLASSAAGVYAYPQAGQSQEQQRKDQMQCQSWAKNQTGFDPARAPAPVTAHYSSPAPKSGAVVFGKGDYGEGGGVLDAGKGAGLGAIFGAIAGNAGAGAAIGAASGLFLGGVRRSNDQAERDAWARQQQQQQQQQQQAAANQRSAREQEYRHAFGTFMRARKYQVD